MLFRSDPFLRYSVPPQPLHDTAAVAVIEKLVRREAGEIAIAPSATSTRITRKVTGRGRLLDASGMTEVETWLNCRA